MRDNDGSSFYLSGDYVAPGKTFVSIGKLFCQTRVRMGV